MSESEFEEYFKKLTRLFARRRLGRSLMYALLTIGATVSFFTPSQILLQQTSPVTTAIWSLGFSIAAATCLYGSLRDKWIQEYIMIPLLSSTLVVFGIAMVGQANEEEKWLTIPYACFFFAFATGLLIRWKDVHSLVRATSEYSEGSAL